MTDNHGGKVARFFIHSKLTVMIMIFTTIFGLGALFLTPREENPQIKVAAANILIQFPGASANEVEKLVAEPIERLIWEIRGIEEVYSVSQPSMAVVTAKFFIGEDLEESVFKVFETVYSNLDLIPDGVLQPLVKPIDIDDVPIVSITLFSDSKSDYELRRAAEKVLDRLKQIDGTNYAEIKGGQSRQINVELKPDRLAEAGLSPLQVVGILKSANVRYPADDIERNDIRQEIQVGDFLKSAEDIESLIVGAPDGKPVYLRDVADVTDGQGERSVLTRIGFGESQKIGNVNPGSEYQAVTLSLAKKRGLNSVKIADRILIEMENISTELPDNVQWIVTRNDGEKANAEVNELVQHLFWAIVIVVILLFLSLGWRDALIVSISIPLTLFITLSFGALIGQTINRITLFALILSLGLLVDDAIVVVENIHRHMKLGCTQGKTNTCVGAVNEIAYPTIYATFTVILSMATMAYVTGMMGPYMAPIPFNVPTAMLVSMFVAFAIVPYLARRFLKVKADPVDTDNSNTPIFRIYNRLMRPLLDYNYKRRIFLSVLVVLFMVVMTFPVLKLVKFRMLPKQNANTFLITMDMPDGTGLFKTDAAAREVSQYISRIPEVADYEVFVGTGSVIDFNGLLRGTSFRNRPHFADIRVNLSKKHHRERASEDIVYSIRDDIARIGLKTGANIKIVENPPGPPVRSTLLAEIYGEDFGKRSELANKVAGWFSETRDVVDIDTSTGEDVLQKNYTVNREKASLAGLDHEQIVQSLTLALRGYNATTLHLENEENQVPVNLRFSSERRNRDDFLEQVRLPNKFQRMVPLSEIVDIESTIADKPIFHKNLKPVSYVFGEMGKRSSVYATIDLIARHSKDPFPKDYKLIWEGEWDLTLIVFRDLGMAMGVSILLIYMILVARFKSFVDPLIVMGAIPLTMIGIMPGFAALGNMNIFFSATGMIGIIALSGIVVRNSLILLEFIQDRKAEGLGITESLIQAGATRTRPIVLTAAATIASMLTIVLDPVWSGLAWTVLFGMIASTGLTLIVIPVLYYSVHKRGWERERELKKTQ